MNVPLVASNRDYHFISSYAVEAVTHPLPPEPPPMDETGYQICR